MDDLYDRLTGALLPRWWRDAACLVADPGVFFPDRGEPHGPAKAICATCTVREQCLELALEEHLTDGIWGGLSPRERGHPDDADRRWREGRKHTGVLVCTCTGDGCTCGGGCEGLVEGRRKQCRPCLSAQYRLRRLARERAA